MYCEFAEQACISRLRVLEFVADRPVIYFSTHFPESVPLELAQNFFTSLTGAAYRRWVEIGEGTHMVLLEKNRLVRLPRIGQPFFKKVQLNGFKGDKSSALSNYMGTRTGQDGAKTIIQLATLDGDGPTGGDEYPSCLTNRGRVKYVTMHMLNFVPVAGIGRVRGAVLKNSLI